MRAYFSNFNLDIFDYIFYNNWDFEVAIIIGLSQQIFPAASLLNFPNIATFVPSGK